MSGLVGNYMQLPDGMSDNEIFDSLPYAFDKIHISVADFIRKEKLIPDLKTLKLIIKRPECSPDGDDFADELTLPSITVGMKIICYECFELCNVYQIKGPNGICVSACKDEDYDGRCDHCPCYLRYKKSEEGEQP